MRGTVAGIRLVLAACLFVPLLAFAAGLGRLTLLSGLGEPLRAEVEVVAMQVGEDDSLTARLASPEAFRQAGIEYSPTLLNLRVSLERREGKPVIRLSSLQPVNDPFVDLLLELQWATGRLVREYTFLLDPPGYRESPAAPGAAAAPAQAPAAAAAPAPPAAPVETQPLATEQPAAKTYEVKKGDTLGRIARANKPEGVTFHQMLVALYRANPEAFIRKNMNLVRAGRILKIPDAGAAESIAVAEANRVVRTHMAEFAEYREKLGAAVAAKPPAGTAGQREVTGRISAKPKPETAPGAAPKDQLKLSKAEAGKPSSAMTRAAREDDKVAANRALQEAQSRVADLEKNVTDLQKLLEMKNKQLAQLEQKAGPPAAASPAAPAPKPAETPKAGVQPAKPAAEAPKPPPVEAPKPVAAAPKPAPVEAPKPTEAPKPAAAAPKPAPKAPPKAAAPPPPEPSLVDEFLGNPVALAGLGAVVLLLVGYGVWAWRRKKAMQTRFHEGALGAAVPRAAGPARAEPTAVPAGAAAAAVVSAAAAAAPQAAAVPEAEEVDPIAEADVYLAYGRDAQAEEILKEALAKEPNRTAVHVKLLEILAHRKDKKGFEKAALTIKELTNASGPEWAKTRTLGHSIDPDNALYGVRAAGETQQLAAEAPAAAEPKLDFDVGGAAPGGGAAAAASLDLDIGAAAPAAEEKKAFSPSDTVVIAPAATPAASAGPAADTGAGAEKSAGTALDFDLGSLEPPAAPAPAAPAPQEGASLDFDLNLDLGGAKPETAPAAAPAAQVDISTINLDLGKPETTAATTSPNAKWQEIATKLDLAKAYQEMGDKDGARELLTQVVNQGDAAQQNQARQLLAALG